MKSRASIPKPIFFTKYFFKEGYKSVMGLEHITGDLREWMQNLHTFGAQAEHMFLQMLRSVAELLTTLQHSHQFHHRDLHAGNVMFRAVQGKKPAFRWYMIDFGMATTVIDGYRVNAEEVGPYNALPPGEELSNYGHDMRLLILSLNATDLRRALPKGPTLDWILQLKESLIEELDNNSIRLDLNREHFHRAYDEALTIVQSPDTEPEAILKDIAQLSRQHIAATKLQSKARQRVARRTTRQRRSTRRRQHTAAMRLQSKVRQRIAKKKTTQRRSTRNKTRSSKTRQSKKSTHSNP